MFDWREEILNNLGTEEWVPLIPFALGCKDLEELRRLKDVISQLKKEDHITLQDVTPEELLDYMKNYYEKKGDSVNKEWKNMWIDYAKKNTEDLKNFFINQARLKKMGDGTEEIFIGEGWYPDSPKADEDKITKAIIREDGKKIVMDYEYHNQKAYVELSSKDGVVFTGKYEALGKIAECEFTLYKNLAGEYFLFGGYTSNEEGTGSWCIKLSPKRGDEV